MARHARARRTLLVALELREGLALLAFLPYDPHQVLHRVLQLLLDLVGVLAAVAALEGRERRFRRPVDRAIVHFDRGALARVLGAVLARALAEDDQIRQRVAAEP